MYNTDGQFSRIESYDQFFVILLTDQNSLQKKEGYC